ncbi:hypothetical protein S8b_00040 [Klebsiella phage vB_Kp3]|nr:hypothetical protein S8b_00040 [Klebsiella phage vB_Kp3]
MTESLKFTSPAPAPVSGVLACASREAGAENNLKLARAIVVEVADRGADQHVKIKVGTLLALALGLEGVMKVMASIEADRDSKIKALSEWEVFGVEMLEQKFKCLPVVNMKPEEKRKRIAAGIDTLTQRLDERSEDLALVDGQLNEWRTHTRHILDTYFATYPTSNSNDRNLRLIMTAAIESAHNKNKQLNKDYNAMHNRAYASDQLREAAERERDDVINLNRNAAEEIAHLQKRNEHLDQTVVDLVRQRDKNGQQANQLANELVEKRKEISRLLEIIDRLHAEIAEKRDIIGAATQRCTALTNDAKAMSKNNSELAARLANAGLEIANYKQLVEDLKAGTAVDRDTVKRQADTIDRLYGQLNEWHDWATDVICSPSSMGAEAQRTAITSAMRKRKERVESLEATVKAIAAQRDAWVLWAKSYTDTCAVAYTNEQLLSLVKAKVKVSTVDIDGKQTMCGTLKVTQLKGDVVASNGSWAMLKHGNAVIAGNIPASKLTLGEEMKEAIREVVREEMSSALKQAIKNELDKLTM